MHESRAKLPKICTKQPDDEVISGNLVIDEMTAEETKDKLKERGNTTKISLKITRTLFEYYFQGGEKYQ